MTAAIILVVGMCLGWAAHGLVIMRALRRRRVRQVEAFRDWGWRNDGEQPWD